MDEYKKIGTIITISLLLIGCNNTQTESKSDIKKEKPFSKSYYQCEKDMGETTLGIANCLREELIYQDEKLNRNYKEAKNIIQPFRMERLKKIQRIWINYRDEKCGFFNHKESGSSGSLDEQMCQIKETIARAKELKEIF